MPRPAEGYRLKDGTRVPGVTTICNLAKDAGPLIHWAWRLGMEQKDYRQVRDDAATAGTLAHQAVEAWITGRPFTMTGDEMIVRRAQTAYAAFLQWATQSNLLVTDPEHVMISERLRVGGTADCIILDGRRAIGDWKSADGLYPEALMQLSAYGMLFEETHGEPITGGYHLIRFDKTHGDYHHHFWPELEAARRAFELCRELYDLQRDLKQRCR